MMQRDSFYHIAGNITHQHFGPLIIIDVGAGCNTKETIAVGPVGHESCILFINIGVILGCHVATTAPYFITYSPYFYVPWFFSAILYSPFAHRAGFAIKVYILYPIRKFLYRTTAYIARQVRFRTYLLTHI